MGWGGLGRRVLGSTGGLNVLTRLVVRNFKRFSTLDVELGSPVVFIGPNNSGKTSALQALALWEAGVRKWNERRGASKVPEHRPGVTINRKDLVAMPVPDAGLLWNDRKTRRSQRVGGRSHTANIRMEITVSGAAEAPWQCGLEFDYANEESLYCRPLRTGQAATDGRMRRMPVPAEAGAVHIAFLPPMSGLAAGEIRLDPGTIQVRIGEGRTAEVLRNLCYRVTEETDRWDALAERIRFLFGVKLDRPEFHRERGEVTMTYRERGLRFDLSASGRGLQQTLLLLSYMYANPGSVLLLDEPDAHLEILRQRQTYALIGDVSREQGSQIIAASHSEVVLNEAADRDVVIAFVGAPRRLGPDRSQAMKALREIGFDQYYLAQYKGWVLYLEGSTDLANLQALAEVLQHPAADLLASRPFVHYVGNQPQRARDHFFGLRLAKPDLVGIALFDRLERPLRETEGLTELMWSRRELENYIAHPRALERWAREQSARLTATPPAARTADPALAHQADLFEEHAARAMHDAIGALVPLVAQRDPDDPWWTNTKMSDDFLDRLFPAFYARLGLPDIMRKSDGCRVARRLERGEVAPEVSDKLDRIVEVAALAHGEPPP